MNRRQLMMLPGAAFAMHRGSAQVQQAQQAGGPSSSGAVQDIPDKILPDKILLRDYRPKSIYKIPKTEVKKAKYPIIDVHTHAVHTPEDVDQCIKIMDAVGMEKAVVFSGGTGARFDEVYRMHSKYADRFDLWCGFDLTGSDKPGFGPDAVKELERCHQMGARGVGEISDKGRGIGGALGGARPQGRPGPPRPATTGPHADDPLMDPLFEKCGLLGMPVNIHVSDPIWGYEPMDKTNDGLMNGFSWRMDDKPGIMGHNELIESLERAVKKHPKTVFIACHFANLDYNLTRLGQMFDRNPNLYADISARYAETAPIPRFVSQFYQKYAHRLLYGTDMPFSQRMFSATFRILETLDEHFYENDLNFNFDYHWPLHGFGLPDTVLRKVYRESALEAFQQAQENAG